MFPSWKQAVSSPGTLIIPDTFHQHLIFMPLVLSCESLIASPRHAVLSTQHGSPAATRCCERTPGSERDGERERESPNKRSQT